MSKYRFRAGSRFSGDAQVVAEELERIRLTEGSLRSEAVVHAAEPDEAPLHPFFEWDDAVAAHAHRLQQARQLVRAVVVVEDGGQPTSLYVHATSSAVEGQYEPLSAIVSKPDLYMQALVEARKDLAAAQRRVTELLDVARTKGAKKSEIAHIMLAVQALQTANEAIQSLH